MAAAHLLNLHDDLCGAAKSLMVRKNHDYTSDSGDPFANFRGSTYLGIDPVLGVMLRMQDKMMRVRTFAEKGQLQVKDEGVKDALVDLINYTVLMYGLVLEEREIKINEGPTTPAVGDGIAKYIPGEVVPVGSQRYYELGLDGGTPQYGRPSISDRVLAKFSREE